MMAFLQLSLHFSPSGWIFGTNQSILERVSEQTSRKVTGRERVKLNGQENMISWNESKMHLESRTSFNFDRSSFTNVRRFPPTQLIDKRETVQKRETKGIMLKRKDSCIDQQTGCARSLHFVAFLAGRLGQQNGTRSDSTLAGICSPSVRTMHSSYIMAMNGVAAWIFVPTCWNSIGSSCQREELQKRTNS